jgi:hypothetical protein
MRFSSLPALLAVAVLGAGFADSAAAHCDSLDGPVVRDARAALQNGDPTLVLRWVGEQQEPEIRAAFARTLAVRGAGAQAQELADSYFFETLVRLHRAGEGEAFTGLKPAGSIDPAIADADHALQSGSGPQLAMRISAAVDAGIRRRFEAAAEARNHAGESVAAGRDYVEAYVEYVHFVESVVRIVEQGAPRTHHDAIAGAGE